MKVKDSDDGEGTSEDMEIVGISLTWLTRTKLPHDGEMDGKFTERLTLGVKLAGMMLDGIRVALLSDSINVVVAIIRGRKSELA
jgi:hypothetical protein